MIKRPKTKIQDSSPMYGFDPKIGFWGLKNLNHKAYFDYEIENPIDVYHNNEGLREDDFKESNKGSIICCGGSHTWGAGIKQNERYSDLSSPCPDYRKRIPVFGCMGTGRKGEKKQTTQK